MTSILYVGMDVHKENYTLCCYSYIVEMKGSASVESLCYAQKPKLPLNDPGANAIEAGYYPSTMSAMDWLPPPRYFALALKSLVAMLLRNSKCRLEEAFRNEDARCL